MGLFFTSVVLLFQGARPPHRASGDKGLNEGRSENCLKAHAIEPDKESPAEEERKRIAFLTDYLLAGLGSILDTVSKDTEDTALSNILSVS